MGGYYASIAKSLERIADALEKMTAPSGQDWGPKDEERFIQALEKAFQEEALRLQAKDTGLFQIPGAFSGGQRRKEKKHGSDYLYGAWAPGYLWADLFGPGHRVDMGG